MTPAPGARRFSDAVLNAVSSETRKSLHAFAESIARAEGVLREHHAAVLSRGRGRQCPHGFDRLLIQRLVNLHEEVLLSDVDGLDRGPSDRAATDARRIGYQLPAAEFTDAWHPHHRLDRGRFLSAASASAA
jgi:hypothetical protein